MQKDSRPAVLLPDGPIEGLSAWYGPALASRPEDWIYRLSPADVDELEAALASTQRRGLAIGDLRRPDFPLPGFGPVLQDMHRELLQGRGFHVLRGLPLAGRSIKDAATIFWGIGTWLGQARSQNASGELISHVRDIGLDHADPNVRTYQTNQRQNYHTDSCDVVGLLCLQTARRGGLSSVVSSVTIYNEIIRRRPDLLTTLFEPFPTDRRGEIPAGMLPYFPIPIYHWYEGLLSAIYSRTYILSSQRLPEAPRLTPSQIEAMTLFDSLAESPELHLDMELEPGDMQFVHNHQMLHDRTAFEDWPEPERKRHLLRLWLCPPDGRPLPDVFTIRYGSTVIGDRGGIMVPSTREHVAL